MSFDVYWSKFWPDELYRIVVNFLTGFSAILFYNGFCRKRKTGAASLVREAAPVLFARFYFFYLLNISAWLPVRVRVRTRTSFSMR